jgi:hypothetical protein
VTTLPHAVLGGLVAVHVTTQQSLRCTSRAFLFVGCVLACVWIVGKVLDSCDRAIERRKTRGRARQPHRVRTAQDVQTTAKR